MIRHAFRRSGDDIGSRERRDPGGLGGSAGGLSNRSVRRDRRAKRHPGRDGDRARRRDAARPARFAAFGRRCSRRAWQAGRSARGRLQRRKLDAAFEYMFRDDPFSGHVVIRTTDAISPGSTYRLWTTLKVPQGFSLRKHAELLAPQSRRAALPTDAGEDAFHAWAWGTFAGAASNRVPVPSSPAATARDFRSSNSPTSNGAC